MAHLFWISSPMFPTRTPFQIPKPDGSTNWMQSRGVTLHQDLENPDNCEEDQRDVSCWVSMQRWGTIDQGDAAV